MSGAESFDARATAARLTAWIRRRVRSAGAAGSVLGLSGGLDSAVVAGLARRAFPDATLGLILPCESDPRDVELAHDVAHELDVPVRVVDLGPAYRALLSQIGQAGDGAAGRLPQGNLKARLRMACLYYHANLLNYLVIGSGNRCELELGYFTKYGDGGVDLLPLARLVKSQVRKVGQHLGVPAAVLERPPTAGLWPGQTDEGELGLTYAELDAYLLTGAGPRRVVERAQTLSRRGRHKRQLPSVPRR
jgi:NAD+ synthase